MTDEQLRISYKDGEKRLSSPQRWQATHELNLCDPQPLTHIKRCFDNGMNGLEDFYRIGLVAYGVTAFRLFEISRSSQEG